MNCMTDVWSVFGRDLGQIVEEAYRYHEPTNRVICRTTDRSDGRVHYDAATCPDDLDWNGSEASVDMSGLEWSPLANSPFED